jgi:hypothetical protein
MKAQWKTGDIVDFEYFHRMDQALDEARLDRRDRDIFLRDIAPKIPSGHVLSAKDNRFLVREWLEVRRNRDDLLEDDDMMLPGDAYTDFVRSLKVILFAGGLAAGSILAVSLLQYKGDAPINVTFYMGGLILSQFLMAGFMAIFVGLRSTGIFNPEPSTLYGWIARYLARGMAKLKASAEGSMISAARRQSMQAVLDLVRMKNKIYGKVFYWPLFRVAQIFGIGFNVGALAGTLVQVVGKDLAFGWQTTLEPSDATIHQIIRVLAWPWKGMVPEGMAHPTLEQISGSRMFLKEGIYHLSTTDLVSWWPFLCLCLIFYGFMPRVLFYVWGVFMERLRLAQLTFSHADGLRLVTRLTTPMVDSSGKSFRGDILPSASLQWTTLISPPHDATGTPAPRFTALIPEDIFEAVKMEDLVRHFAPILGARQGTCLKVTLDSDSDYHRLKSEIADQPESGKGIVFVLLEAWQPPIKEVITYLEDLRVMLGKTAPVYIGLVGKPRPDDIFSPVEETDWKLWSRKTGALNDPFIILERIA